MKNIFLTIVLFSLVVAGKAQFAYDYLKAADYYYKNADYSSAAQYYEKYLAGNRSIVSHTVYKPYTTQASTKKTQVAVSNEQQAIYRLAESYRLLNDYGKSVPWYEEALEFDKTRFPLAPYYYAVALRALARYDVAEKAFDYFLQSYMTEDVYRESATRELQNLRFILQQLRRPDLSLYSVEKGPAVLNPQGANYAPVWLGDSLLLFTSTRPDNSGSKKHVFTNRIYGAAYTNGQPDTVTRISVPQPKDAEQGVISITQDGNVLFLTRWLTQNGKKTSAIYSSRKNDGKWSEPALLDTVVNTPGYSAQQPFVSPDGKRLFYASDRPGGQGGFDLWSAELTAEGSPFSVKNLGPVLNTSRNEQAPYFHTASGVLVFSTDGRVGMGGFDFFYSKDSANSWQEPVNFGYPVNSVKDDLYFNSKGNKENILETVWLSSDRDASCCLELFALKKSIPVPPPPPPTPPVVVMVTPPPPDVPTVLDNVYYDFSQSYLQPASYPALDKLAAMLQQNPDLIIELSAHTDSKGKEELNQRLSEARAKSCVDYLVSKGIDAARLQYKGYAASRPIAPNQKADGSDNPEGRAMNRRTEFKVVGKK
ncbi:Outer membrane protein OmpA [Chitinophaga sp. CF118]|uniref:OmpA family protein n=1 Tax=Chitinophaga sp. CF118 TaxID=1884367 RepID=UPI0008E4915F|nr:OmpA family protein [Chitinophaga sp. CF118]SFE06394.1 Outer membrane protein OmpA [Chitinophaga sp. CF118]